MSNPQPIQFLLHQLATNEQDLNSINQSKIFRVKKEGGQLFLYHKNFTGELASDDFTGGGYLLDSVLQNPNLEILAIEFIRTCLSRVNGEAVLGVFEGSNSMVDKYDDEFGLYLTVLLYTSFDEPLQFGKTLDEAIQALHDKMLELVPEYREFLNNNK